jgi:uncharacterized protein (TIGR02453 family)
MKRPEGRQYFTPQTFAFLTALAENNRREWFEAHRQDYEEFVRMPALELISDMAGELPAISRHFAAQPRKVGGSLMRVQRDTRFSRDKTLYKTNIGIQFRHEQGKDIHAPGFYLHIAPDECFFGIGLWHPDSQALGRIREAIAERSAAWLAARDDKAFRRHFTLDGDSLVKPPRGFAKDHPLIEDLRRKDFIGMAPLTAAQAISAILRPLMVKRFCQAAPYIRFLCQALDLSF